MFSWALILFIGLISWDETSATHAKRRRDLYSHCNCNCQGEEWEQEREEEEELRITCDSIMDITGYDWTRQDRTSI
jgi:hypothetical protein